MFRDEKQPLFFPSSLKITSGEISAKEAAEERIWAGRTPPAEAPGPGRSEECTRYHMKMHTHKTHKDAKTSKNIKLRKNLKVTLKRGIILVRTSRFWYDNGMLWYCNCCFEIMNDHKKIVKI